MPETIKYIFFFILLSLFAGLSNAQIKGRFLKDSIKIGEPVKYSLTYSHSPEIELLLPDSNFNFSPFEYIKKEFYPTKTNHSKSKDSVVYILRSFEKQKFLKLALPVFIISDNDSITIYSSTDTVFIKELISEAASNLKFKEITDFNFVEKKYNYPYAIAIYGGISFLLLIAFIFLGDPVKKRYKSFIIRRAHLNYIRNYKKLEKEFIELKNHSSIEQALSMWKSYLSKLEDKPINTYTTTEIISLYNKEDLKISLQTIDRAIYGGLVSDEAVKALKSLRKFSNKRFLKRKEEINHV